MEKLKKQFDCPILIRIESSTEAKSSCSRYQWNRQHGALSHQVTPVQAYRNQISNQEARIQTLLVASVLLVPHLMFLFGCQLSKRGDL